MESKKKIINLSWLVEKWTIWDDRYLKNIWLNLETLDLVRISDAIESSQDLEENYIDIETHPEEFVCMPSRNEIDIRFYRESFIDSLSQSLKDQFFENYNELAADEEFLDKVYELGLENQLNDFRNKVAAKILWQWATDENIKVRKDVDFDSITNV